MLVFQRKLILGSGVVRWQVLWHQPDNLTVTLRRLLLKYWVLSGTLWALSKRCLVFATLSVTDRCMIPVMVFRCLLYAFWLVGKNQRVVVGIKLLPIYLTYDAVKFQWNTSVCCYFITVISYLGVCKFFVNPVTMTRRGHRNVANDSEGALRCHTSSLAAWEADSPRCPFEERRDREAGRLAWRRTTQSGSRTGAGSLLPLCCCAVSYCRVSRRVYLSFIIIYVLLLVKEGKKASDSYLWK